MGSLQVDVDALAGLSKTLHQLAGAAGGEKVGAAAGPFIVPESGTLIPQTAGSDDVMSSVLAAADVCHNLIEKDLIPAIRERLKTTGDVMNDVAREYRGQDEKSAEMISAYRNALGDWKVQGQQ